MDRPTDTTTDFRNEAAYRTWKSKDRRFTPIELERILRYYDIDSAQLPTRLETVAGVLANTTGLSAAERQMIVRYTAYDLRFTRKTGPAIPLPYLPQGRRFMCHLFAPTRIVSVTEDGRVMPCSAIGHRHASPVIADLDAFGRLPIDLAQYIEDRHAQLFALKGTTDCDLQCQRVKWNLDGC